MGFWAFYFLLKIYLNLQGIIGLNLLPNILFALFLCISMPRKTTLNKVITKLLLIVNICIGIGLFWHDSWLPSPIDVYDIFKRDGIPSNEYIVSFLMDYYHPKLMMEGLAAMMICIVIARYIRIMNIVIVILVLLFPYRVSGQTGIESIDTYVEDFFDSEKTRFIKFPTGTSEAPDFDIIFIHICSLAWDDLEFAHLRNHQVFKMFDFLFTSFNSVTSYSGPAMIRLMDASCGQARHRDVYKKTQSGCRMFQDFTNAGFDVSYALNHNGVYGHFAKEITEFGHIYSHLIPAWPDNRRVMFDGSPVYDDSRVLDQWWASRPKNPKNPTVLYYNTVTLHDGVHIKNTPNWWSMDKKAFYKKSLQTLLDEIQRFIKKLERSGKKFVFVMIPEHGMAIRGSRIQKSGLRDIPLPYITNIPVGIKFIGGKYTLSEFGTDRFKQIKINSPASYLAIAYLMNKFIRRSPFSETDYFSKRFIYSIPITDFVAENESGISVKFNGRYFFKMRGKSWTAYNQ